MNKEATKCIFIGHDDQGYYCTAHLASGRILSCTEIDKEGTKLACIDYAKIPDENK